jgi:hypothetical protein
MPRRILIVLVAAIILAVFVPPVHAAPAPQVMTRELARQMGLQPVRITAAMKAAGADGPVGALAYDGPRACDGWLTPSGLWKLSHCTSPFYFENTAEFQAHARLHVYRRDNISAPWKETGTQTLTINDWGLGVSNCCTVNLTAVTSTDGTGVEDYYGPAGGWPISCGQIATTANFDESFRTPGGTAFYGPGAGTSPETVYNPPSQRC